MAMAQLLPIVRVGHCVEESTSAEGMLATDFDLSEHSQWPVDLDITAEDSFPFEPLTPYAPPPPNWSDSLGRWNQSVLRSQLDQCVRQTNDPLLTERFPPAESGVGGAQTTVWVPRDHVSPDGCFLYLISSPGHSPVESDIWAFSHQSLVVFEPQGNRAWLAAPQVSGEYVWLFDQAHWSPDSSSLAFYSTPALRVFVDGVLPPGGVAQMEDTRGWSLNLWSAETGETTLLCERGYFTNPNSVNSALTNVIEWSGDSRRLLFVTALDRFWDDPHRHQSEGLHICDLDTGEIRRLVGDSRFSFSFQWMSDDLHVLAMVGPPKRWDQDLQRMVPRGGPTDGSEVWVINSATGEHRVALHLWETPDLHPGTMHVSPDMRWCAFSFPIDEMDRMGDRMVYLLDLETDSPPIHVANIRTPGRDIRSVEYRWPGDDEE